MPVRRKQLQGFERERAADDDSNYQHRTAPVTKGEYEAKECECRKMLNLSTGDDRPSRDRRQRRIYDETESRPARQNAYLLRLESGHHTAFVIASSLALEDEVAAGYSFVRQRLTRQGCPIVL